jgi:hypothetical protein
MIEKYLAHWLTAMAVKMGLMKVQNTPDASSRSRARRRRRRRLDGRGPVPAQPDGPGVRRLDVCGRDGVRAGSLRGRGYDIPTGVNPVVQAHAKEMILPEKFADVIRGMAEGGGSGGGRAVPLS